MGNLSVTGDRLNAPFYRLDIIKESPIKAKVYWLNQCGMIPVVSTLTGVYRTLLGLVHLIVHLVKSIFDAKNRSTHLQEATLGAYNILRGLIEIVPMAGNMIVSLFDMTRLYYFEQRMKLLA